MIEKLKDLEEEAITDIGGSEIYESIVSNVMEEGEQWIYQSGYIDGLQTAIRILAEQSETMSYSVDMEDIFYDDYPDRDDEGEVDCKSQKDYEDED